MTGQIRGESRPANDRTRVQPISTDISPAFDLHVVFGESRDKEKLRDET